MSTEIIVVQEEQGGFFAEREFAEKPVDAVILTGAMYKKGQLMKTWKYRGFSINKQQKLKYFSATKDEDSADEKGDITLHNFSLDLGPKSNVDQAFTYKTSGNLGVFLQDSSSAGSSAAADWVPLTLTDFSANPPRIFEFVLDSHEATRKFILALHRVGGRNNLKEFIAQFLSESNPLAVNIEEWLHWRNQVMLFPRRLTYPKDVALKSACCCCNLAFYDKWPECCGGAQLFGCCCGEFYCQYGLAKDRDIKEGETSIYNCIQGLQNNFCSSQGYTSLRDMEHIAKSAKWHDRCIDFKESTCCFHFCEIPYCQFKQNCYKAFCRVESNLLCLVNRFALPNDSSVPCEIGCCGILLVDKEEMVKDVRKVYELTHQH